MVLKSLLFTVLIKTVILQAVQDFFDLSADDSLGNKVQFSQFSGKVVLVVNVASECGFTESHYKGLQRLHDILNFNNKFAILAFPCNQFGGQEPGSREDIRHVAFKQYGVRFNLMDKVEVTGTEAHPVWKYLTETSGVVPQWNFYKYLLDHQGNIVQVWPPQTPVEDIYDAVERAVHEADDELQVESPLGSHDEL